jgi:hypothetical protein
VTLLGPRTVTVAYNGGPADGTTTPYQRDNTPMPDRLGTTADTRYKRSHLDPITDTWHYRWDPPRTGLRNPCRAGEHTCPGGRCPDGRARQHR